MQGLEKEQEQGQGKNLKKDHDEEQKIEEEMELGIFSGSFYNILAHFGTCWEILLFIGTFFPFVFLVVFCYFLIIFYQIDCWIYLRKKSWISFPSNKNSGLER